MKIWTKLAVLTSAVLYGLVEAFIFTHGFHPGEPNFVHFFTIQYHLPLAGIAFLIVVGFGQLRMFPAWIVMEDLVFFVFNSSATLDASSWIAAGLGGVHIFGGFIPTTYILLLALWLLLEWWYRSPRSFNQT